jgi:hAT family C-terminal dimerisation region
MTVLAIPATSVPSERVFSSSGRTDTPERNKLSPAMMEALQVLKFNHRSGALDYLHNYLESPDDLERVLLEEMTEEELRDNIREVLTNN